jgi:hypothetical protein
MFSEVPGSAFQFSKLLRTVRDNKSWQEEHKITVITDRYSNNIAGLDIPDEALTFLVLKYGIKLPALQE